MVTAARSEQCAASAFAEAIAMAPGSNLPCTFVRTTSAQSPGAEKTQMHDGHVAAVKKGMKAW
jgi:hypothetical protein